MTAPTITTLPTAPLVNDSPSVFNTHAFAWVGSIAGLTSEINAFGAYLNSYVAPTAPLTGGSIPVFGASGSSHSAGAVPDPGSTAGTTRFLCENATFRALVLADVPTLPIVLGPYFGTTPTASETLHVAYFDRNVKLTAGLASSKWTVETNPAATFVLTLRKNGTSIGTVSFSTGGVATVTFTTDTTFTAWTDKFSITAPGTADTTVAGISVTLKFDPV